MNNAVHSITVYVQLQTTTQVKQEMQPVKKNDPVETNRCFSAAVRDNKTKTVQRKFPG